MSNRVLAGVAQAVGDAVSQHLVASGVVSAALGVAAATVAGLTVGEMFMTVLALELAQMPLLFHLHGRVARVETVAEINHD